LLHLAAVTIEFRLQAKNSVLDQQFPDSKKCREIGTFVGEAS
jgi:hypothetical protein